MEKVPQHLSTQVPECKYALQLQVEFFKYFIDWGVGSGDYRIHIYISAPSYPRYPLYLSDP